MALKDREGNPIPPQVEMDLFRLLEERKYYARRLEEITDSLNKVMSNFGIPSIKVELTSYSPDTEIKGGENGQGLRNKKDGAKAPDNRDLELSTQENGRKG